MKAIVISATALIVAASPAYASAKYLDSVESPVFQTAGDHQAITKRALTCIAQIIKPGFIDAPTVKSSDLDAGIIVANNGFGASWGLLTVSVRTILTFEAKDGRFKITHTSIEDFSGYPNNQWGKVGIWPGSGYKHIDEGAQTISKNVADCVMNNNAKSDW